MSGLRQPAAPSWRRGGIGERRWRGVIRRTLSSSASHSPSTAAAPWRTPGTRTRATPPRPWLSIHGPGDSGTNSASSARRTCRPGTPRRGGQPGPRAAAIGGPTWTGDDNGGIAPAEATARPSATNGVRPGIDSDGPPCFQANPLPGRLLPPPGWHRTGADCAAPSHRSDRRRSWRGQAHRRSCRRHGLAGNGSGTYATSLSIHRPGIATHAAAGVPGTCPSPGRRQRRATQRHSAGEAGSPASLSSPLLPAARWRSGWHRRPSSSRAGPPEPRPHPAVCCLR